MPDSRTTHPDRCHSVRYRPAGPADGGGGHRRAARHLQAQRAVPAGRPPLVLLRLHGCDGAQPLSADPRLSQGRAREGGLLRPPAGELPERGGAVLDQPERRPPLDGSLDAMQKAVDYMRKRRRCDAQAIGVEMPFLPADAAMSLRAAPSRTATSRMRCSCWSGCARASVPTSSPCCARPPSASCNSMQAVIAKHAPGMTKQELAEALRREEVKPRADVRVLPDHGRHQPQPRAVGRSAGARAISSRSTPAATITATSATSAAWPSSASRMPSCEDLLGEIETIQRAAIKPIKAGADRRR